MAYPAGGAPHRLGMIAGMDNASVHDPIDRARWDASHALRSPLLEAIKRRTLCAALPSDVVPTTLWPAWPLDELGQAMALDHGNTLVDLACGRGDIGRWIGDHFAVDVIGVDPSPVGLSLAEAASQSHPPKPGRSRTYVEGHFLHTGLADGAADAVLICDALHFTSDRRATFRELARVLRAGGRVAAVGIHWVPPMTDVDDTGLVVEEFEETPSWRSIVRSFVLEIERNADALRAEMDTADVDRLLELDLEALEHATHGLIVLRRS